MLGAAIYYYNKDNTYTNTINTLLQTLIDIFSTLVK